MVTNCISNTGPVLHLHAIDSVFLLKLFDSVRIPPEVEKELQKHGVPEYDFIKTTELAPSSKDLTEALCLRFGLDLGESQALTLAKQESGSIFFTDDLDAREAAKIIGTRVHGTIGIILRNFREGELDKKDAIAKLYALRSTDMFLTSALVEEAVRAIERYPEK